MAMAVHIKAEPDFILAVVTGEFSLEEAKRTSLEIFDAVAQTKIEKVLVDGWGLTGVPTVMDRFQYAEFVAEAVMYCRMRGIVVLPKFAYVLKRPVLDPDKFVETVAANRGLSVKTCDNMDEALAWLEARPASKPKA